MKKKVLLIDGLSIANRAYYGIPLLTNQEGLYTNAIYGFLNIMLSMIEKEKPDLVGVAFDVNAPTFRHIKVQDYKGTRKGMPSELKVQIPVLKQVLDTLGIKRIEMEGFEADDLLGTLAKEGEKDGLQVVVLSGDRDLLQITTQQVEVKIPKTKKGGTEIESYFAKDVVEAYEVTPIEFIDVKGLMGDASDNIKGVPGVGEKTAVKLIKTYGTIENLYEHIDEITQKKLKENLENNKEQAIESKMLATIICDIPLEYAWDEFDYSLCLNKEGLELFKKLEFKKLISKFKKDDTQTEKVQEFAGDTAMAELMEEANSFPVGIAYFKEGSMFGLSMSTQQKTAFKCYDLTNEAEHQEVKTFFEAESKIKVIHDTKRIRHELIPFGIELKGQLFDTLIAAYLLSPTSETYDIAELAEIFLDMDAVQDLEVVLGKGKSKKTWLDLEVPVMQQLLQERAYIVQKAYTMMHQALEEKEMLELFETMEMPLVEVLFDMEKEGIRINPDQLTRYGEELSILIDETAKKVYEQAGEEFNINSPKQLGIVLFEKMDIPAVKKTKTGYSTAAEVLETLKDNYPIVEDILAYRQYTKLKSTYVDGLLTQMTEDHKIHSTFNQTITATGRISSTEPNLQNIPIKLEMGKKIREVFIPRSDDYIFLDADYSQIELRVLASMADDEVLIDAFNNQIDIHRLTASQVFHIPFDEVTSLQRSNAKAVNFGIVYGMGAFSLAQDLGITQKEASEYIEGYFDKYPRIKKYLNSLVATASMYGYVETYFNRKRDIPEINAKNHSLREFGKRKAMNTPIQGTAADIIKIAMIRVHQALKAQGLQSKLILTVHDELLLDVYKPEQEQVAILLKHEMEHAIDMKVKMSVDVHVGENWLETK